MLKGNVIVGQSGGPTSVINSSLVGVFKASKDNGAGTVYGMLHGIEGLLKRQYVDLSEHIRSELEVELLKRTPSSFLGSCRFKLPEPDENTQIYEQLFNILTELDIKHFFYIGGNDSMDTIKKLSYYGKETGRDITFIGVPKTIDNDLAITDHTPGYGSAAKYIASVMKEIIRDSKIYDLDSVTIVEIMGRNAGWLTAASALSKGEDCVGPDLIYLPEIPFDYNEFISKIERKKKERKSVVIAVSEGIRTKDGLYVCENDKPGYGDSFGHNILGGTALKLADFVGSELGVKARGIELSTLQRCASHIVSRTDITEAYMAGADAVKLAMKGESGKMIIFDRISNDPYLISTAGYDVNMIANKEKLVPKEWIIDDGTYISNDFAVYAAPLIIGELPPFMVEGLPRHLYIDDAAIKS
ncbi:MAG: 6-phosphofructokinase [Clostridiales bacterium]|nr:6-phosphofructokinase [Clostridiales bacterium]